MRIVIIIGACVMLYFILRHLFRHNPKQFTRYFFFTAVVLFTVGLFALAITGRLHWLFALLAGLIPWLRRLVPLLKFIPLVKFFQGLRGMRQMGGSRSAGQRSNVSSHYFKMSLNHDSGEIVGEVLAGEFAGRSLLALSDQQLKRLLQECRSDSDSYALLCSYLSYRFGGNWQNQFDVESEDGESPQSAQTDMTRAEALDILGLEEPVDRASIIKAHRSLMQRFHPDRGGSNYIASKINEAKDLLLRETSSQGA